MPALTGLRVLDFTLNLPGPYATSVLAAQGADVVKIEPPRGDPARHLPGFFARLNAGKRSVALDLRSEDRDHLPALFAWADVLVEGFRPGVMERLGADPGTVHSANPRCIYTRISAFGQTGPRAQEPGHDLNLQALTGLCHLERGERPQAIRLPVADLSASMAAVAAIGIALSGPRESVVLDISMAETLRSWTWVWEGVDPGAPVDATLAGTPLRGLTRRLLAPLRRKLQREKLYAMPQYGIYATRDGWIAVGIVDERHFWKAFAEGLGLHRHASLSMGALTLLGPYLRRRIAARLRTHPTTHWLQVLEGLPVSPVLDAHGTLSEPHFAPRTAGGQVLPPLPGALAGLAPPPELGSTPVEALIDP